MENFKLSSPWMTFANEITALFENDEGVKVVHDTEANEIKLYVEDSIKAAALTELLPTEKKFGNVTIKLEVIPANDEDTRVIDLFNAAFAGNSAVSYIKNVQMPVMGSFNYVVFKPEVVQFFNDQLDDVNGNKSMLYQEIAKDVFGGDQKVFFCTDGHKCLGAPLGEWP